MNYTINGDDYPRVSTLLDLLAKPALLGWAAGQVADLFAAERGKIITDEMVTTIRGGWRAKSDKALDVGSEVHRLIESSSGEPLDVADEVHNAFSAWLQWNQDTKPEIIASEVVVYHPDLCYAGRFDAMYRKDGRVILADWKTSGAIYPEYKLQVALYIAALRAMPTSETHFKIGEVTGVQTLPATLPTAGEIVRLDKVTGEYESCMIEGAELERLIEAAEHLVKFYYLFKQRRVKNGASRKAKK